MSAETFDLIFGMLTDEQKQDLWNSMSDEQMESLWKMLSNDQLMKIREEGAMNQRTMQSFKTEMALRCLIEMDEVFEAFMKW